MTLSRDPIDDPTRARQSRVARPTRAVFANLDSVQQCVHQPHVPWFFLIHPYEFGCSTVGELTGSYGFLLCAT